MKLVRLIHMNGRVYDYNLGRFMSVDPVIQSPTNSQSINPYSYIMNNPLAGTDPTGYTGCAASRIESTCESLGSSFGGYDTNYGAEAQANGDASLANSGATAGVSRLVNNGMDRTVSTASSKMESMDIGSQKSVTENKNSPDRDVKPNEVNKFDLANVVGESEASILKKTENYGTESRSLLDGKINVIKYGSKDAVVTDAEFSKVQEAIDNINSTSGFGVYIPPSGSEMLSKIREPLTIILNDHGAVGAMPLRHGGGKITVDLNVKKTFKDMTSGNWVRATNTRLIAHEIAHAVLGLTDRGKNKNQTVTYTDRIMGSINGTQRVKYSNAR